MARRSARPPAYRRPPSPRVVEHRQNVVDAQMQDMVSAWDAARRNEANQHLSDRYVWVRPLQVVGQQLTRARQAAGDVRARGHDSSSHTRFTGSPHVEAAREVLSRTARPGRRWRPPRRYRRNAGRLVRVAGGRSVAITLLRWGGVQCCRLPSVARRSAAPSRVRRGPYHGAITMTDLRDHDDRSA